MKKYSLLAYLGRFQPFHKGHESVVKKALAISERVLIIIGSTNQARSIKNPWSYAERVEMIRGALSPSDAARVVFHPVPDRLYDEPRWIASVRHAVEAHQDVGNKKPVSLIGHSKDETSYYLKSFPRFSPHVEIPMESTINATDIRESYFRDELDSDAAMVLMPTSVAVSLSTFKIKAPVEFEYLQDEQKFQDGHDAMWSPSPYAPTFNTGDAVVIHSGHILLGQRKNAPGKGLWAMPGGYIQSSDLSYKDAALRELTEETGIGVPRSVLQNAVVKQKVFGHPARSSRGRIITEVQLIDLNSRQFLPEIKGSDDIARARWFTEQEFLAMEAFMFEDHFEAAANVLGLVI